MKTVLKVDFAEKYSGNPKRKSYGPASGKKIPKGTKPSRSLLGVEMWKCEWLDTRVTWSMGVYVSVIGSFGCGNVKVWVTWYMGVYVSVIGSFGCGNVKVWVTWYPSDLINGCVSEHYRVYVWVGPGIEKILKSSTSNTNVRQVENLIITQFYFSSSSRKKLETLVAPSTKRVLQKSVSNACENVVNMMSRYTTLQTTT